MDKVRTIGLCWLLSGMAWTFGCASGDDADANNQDTDSTPENETESGSGGSGASGSATASFCNPLSYGDDATTLRLVIGTGDAAVTLTAVTGTCSNRLGDACATIPAGAPVPFVLYGQNGDVLFTTEFAIMDGSVNIYYAVVDAQNNIQLDTGTLHESLACADMECIYPSYNDRTCAADDPCGWSGDSICNEDCVDYLPPGTPMFDDSADCS
jgi:hypothetical protein